MPGFKLDSEDRARRGRLVALAVTLLALAGGAFGAAPAGASRTQESIFQDDRLLVFSDSATRERTLEDMASLGADTVHTLLFWRSVAPAPGDRDRPSGFDPADPASYPAGAWDPYDDVVRGAAARGLDVLMSPSGRVPSWAAGCGGSIRVREVCRPSASEFKAFVTAAGRRYSGGYSDENQGGGVLPRVDRWSVWNEPNLGSWLRPQSVVSRGRRVPYSPRLYRRLLVAGIQALRDTGHGADQILLGETAPLGRVSGSIASRPTAPLDFLREVFCLNSRGRAYRGRAARDRDCDDFRRLDVTGVSHHPYNRGGAGSPRSASKPNEVTISSASRLWRLLSTAAGRRRIPRAASRSIYFTEFGFQTNPPDRLFGVSLTRQARYINEADYIAFRESRVKSVAQYELNDEPDLDSFQTGLRFADGSAKPSLEAYRLPIHVIRRGSRIYVYGQVRRAADASEQQVEIQNGSGDAFETVRTLAVSSLKGHFFVRVPSRSGLWRLKWAPSGGGQAVFSREASAVRG
jgi:hypothetical protein